MHVPWSLKVVKRKMKVIFYNNCHNRGKVDNKKKSSCKSQAFLFGSLNIEVRIIIILEYDSKDFSL